MESALTAAERNRLVIENTELIVPIAATFRGQKGIPFDEMVAEGMLGLVRAAGMWRKKANFATYATHKIHFAIRDFIDRWQAMEGENSAESGREPDDAFFEWDIWHFAAPYECWINLAATPEELVSNYQQIERRRVALRNAMLSLPKRDRKIVYARFMAKPTKTLEEIARDHEISYWRVMFILKRAIRELRKVVFNIENKSGSRVPASKHSVQAA